MAETPVVKPYIFDDKAFLARIEEIKTHMIDTYEGKNGVNPYQWLHDNLQPIEEAYNGVKTEGSKFIRGLPQNKSKELFDKLMALAYKDVIPAVRGPNEFGKPPKNQDIGVKQNLGQ